MPSASAFDSRCRCLPTCAMFNASELDTRSSGISTMSGERMVNMVSDGLCLPQRVIDTSRRSSLHLTRLKCFSYLYTCYILKIIVCGTVIIGDFVHVMHWCHNLTITIAKTPVRKSSVAVAGIYCGSVCSVFPKFKDVDFFKKSGR